MSETLVDPRIRARLEQMIAADGRSAAAISLAATDGRNKDLLRGILAGKNREPLGANAIGLARELRISPEDLTAILRGETGASSRLAGSGRPGFPRRGDVVEPVLRLGRVAAGSPAPDGLPDVPVLGSAAASVVGAFSIDAAIEYVRRPPGLIGARNVYALYVIGESMAPRHRPGDLIFVSPDRPARTGDDVVIQTRDHDGAPTLAWLKTLLRRTDAAVVVEQLHPLATVEFRGETVVAVHRVLTTREMFGA